MRKLLKTLKDWWNKFKKKHIIDRVPDDDLNF